MAVHEARTGGGFQCDGDDDGGFGGSRGDDCEDGGCGGRGVPIMMQVVLDGCANALSLSLSASSAGAGWCA